MLNYLHLNIRPLSSFKSLVMIWMERLISESESLVIWEAHKLGVPWIHSAFDVF